MSVDFPAPFSPQRQCTSPRFRSNEMSCSALTPGNVFDICDKRRISSMLLLAWTDDLRYTAQRFEKSGTRTISPPLSAD